MSRKIRVGILGLGRAGRTMHDPELGLFLDSYEITAGREHATDRLENLPEGFENAKLYSKYEDMLADPELDLINIATRNFDHTPHALMALAAGSIPLDTCRSFSCCQFLSRCATRGAIGIAFIKKAFISN